MKTVLLSCVHACALVFGLVAGGMARADDAGARLYASCAACHGKQAEGNASLRAPALAGLDEAYLLRQLQHFRAGVRGSHPDDQDGATMRSALAVLPDDNAMRAVVATIRAMPLPPPAPLVAGADLTAGRNYYNGICSACHGSNGEGVPALNAPRLLGQNADYLNRQFRHFRLKVRGGHATDKFGGQMVKITKAVADDKLAADIAAYIVQLGRKP